MTCPTNAQMKVCAAALLLALQAGARIAQAQPPLLIYVGIQPQQYLAQQIGGKRVQVEILVPAQASPENYEIKSSQLASLSEARLYARSGMPFENAWLPRLHTEQSTLRVIDCCLPRAGTDQPHAGHAHHNTDQDLHFWTDPLLALQAAEHITNALQEIDPEHAAAYRNNYEALKEKLDRIHRDIQQRLAGVAEGASFFTAHPAWGHFAKRYGLVQISLEYHGHEPMARRLVEVIEQARTLDARAVFVSPQFSYKSSQIFSETLQVPIIQLDPLAADYPKNLLRAADLFAEYLP